MSIKTEKQWFEKLTKRELVHLIDSASQEKQDGLLATLNISLKSRRK